MRAGIPTYGENDICLIKDLNRGAYDAVSYLWDRYSKSIYTFSYELLNDREQAMDIAQECFIQLWKNRANFKELISVKAYLYRIAKNKSLNYIKYINVRRQHDDALMKEITEDFLDEKIMKEDLFSQLYDAISSLPPKTAEVMSLVLKGLSNQDIANSMKITVNTVKTHKARAIKILKDKYSNDSRRLVLFILLCSDFD